MAKRKAYTKAAYEEAARGLAGTLVISCRLAANVEMWIDHLDEWATKSPDSSAALEARLLRDAWDRERKSREARGDCIDCGRGFGHDPKCPVSRKAAQP